MQWNFWRIHKRSKEIEFYIQSALKWFLQTKKCG